MGVRTIRPGCRGLRGYFASRKAGRPVAFESRLERDFYILLESDPDVVAFVEQPVTIEFRGRQRARRYTPDARVTFRDGLTQLVEVKYVVDIAALDAKERLDMDEAHDAARAYCEARSWRFVLRTDRDILGPRLDRAHALRAFARPPNALAAWEPRLLVHIASTPAVTLGELAVQFGAEARVCALHLLWMGSLRDEPVAVPTDATRLYPCGARP